MGLKIKFIGATKKICNCFNLIKSPIERACNYNVYDENYKPIKGWALVKILFKRNDDK